MYHNEITTFHRAPDEAGQLRCRACGAICRVSRGVTGPTCFAEALAGHKRAHDRFTCPRAAEPWHAAALRLYLERQRNPSRVISALLLMELRLLRLRHLHPCVKRSGSVRTNEE